MKYIRPTPNPSGAFPPPQSHAAKNLLAISDELAAVVAASRGFVRLVCDGNKVVNVTPLTDQLAQWKETHSPANPIPAQQRERAYNTQAIIQWDGQRLTVTQAATKWYYYAAEGSARADELQALIVAAKENIRAQYPDEEA